MLENDLDQNILPHNVPLMSSKEKLNLRNEKTVLRYHVPNPQTKPELHCTICYLCFFLSEKNMN